MPNNRGVLVNTAGGWDSANATSSISSLTGSAQTITLTKPSSHIRIQLNGTTDSVQIAFSGAATTSNYKINAGGSFAYDGPPLATFSVIGSGSTDKISVAAW